VIAAGPPTVLGWSLGAADAEGDLLDMSCGGTPVAVQGAAIGVATPAESMTGKLTIAFSGSGGVQSRERFEGGVSETLLLRATGEEDAALTATFALKAEEKVEWRTSQ
jgi:hypothetical protein